MIVERDIFLTITLSAAESYQKNISHKLKPYIGKCYNNCLITDILEVRENTHRLVLPWSTTGDVETNIIMKVQALEIREGTLIKCNVVYIDDGNVLTARDASRRIIVNIVRCKERVQLNQEIVVKVNQTIYQQYMETIVIHGELYKPTISYELDGSINEDTKKYINKIYPALSSFSFTPGAEYSMELSGITKKTLPNKIKMDVNAFLRMAAASYKQLE